MVAALFAVHPINVESVAWVSELKTMLSAAFFFLALGAYHWYAQMPSPRRMGVVAVLYVMGLLAKPQVIMLPIVLLLWDYWPLQRIVLFKSDRDGIVPDTEVGSRQRYWDLLKEKTLLFEIALADAVLTMFAEHKASPVDWPYTFSIRLGNAILSYVRYVGKVFWPFHLSYLYPHPGNSLRWGQVWAALLFLIAVSALVIVQRRRYLIVGWLWFLITMVPVIGLVQIDTPALADRWAYIGNIGLFLMVCWSVSEMAEAWQLPKIILPVTSVALIFALSLVAHRQVSYWKDSISVWTHTMEVTHHNWIAEMNLGVFLRAQGQTERALTYYREAADEQPDKSDVNLETAFFEHQLGHTRQAIHYYERVLAVSKNSTINAQVLANMGHAYSDIGDDARARECYQAALNTHPALPLPPPRPAINWQGDWWHDVGPFLRECFHSWKSRLTS
jgi:protein O-mannosyl-transferase